MRPSLALLLLWLAASLFSPVTSFSVLPRHFTNPCDLTGNSWIPYTGYRIQREVTLVPKQGQSLLTSMVLFFKNKANKESKTTSKFDIVDHVLVTRCDRGLVMYEAASRIYASTSSNSTSSSNGNRENSLSENIWNTTVCTIPKNKPTDEETIFSNAENEGWFGADRMRENEVRVKKYGAEPICFRLARRIKYLEHNSHELRKLIPGTIVGALFECMQDMPPSLSSLETAQLQQRQPATCTRQNIRPVLPLVADKPFHVWTRLVGTPNSGGGVSIRIPLFFTPDIMDKQYPHINTRWAMHPGTSRLRLPHYTKQLQLDRNWARSIDPFEQYVHKSE